jgi:hypothetical protein
MSFRLTTALKSKRANRTCNRPARCAAAAFRTQADSLRELGLLDILAIISLIPARDAQYKLGSQRLSPSMVSNPSVFRKVETPVDGTSRTIS